MGTSTKGVTAATVVVITKVGAAYVGSANSAQNNQVSWATVKAYGAANKVITYGALQKLLKAQHNHQNFAGYAMRRGLIAVK